MAITATIALDRSTTTVNTKVRALCTVSNSGGNPVTVLNAVPRCKATQELFLNQAPTVAEGKIIAGQVVPAGGSNTFVWDTMIEQPNPTTTYDTPAAQNTYNITCLIYCDDGSLTQPTAQTVTIVPNKNYGSF